ncbi:MAG TPA: DUF3592 domain-containing protein [Candidatus Obscuribacterales bacterium]
MGGALMMLAAFLLVSQFAYIDKAVKSERWQPTTGQVVTMKQALTLGAQYDAADDAIRNLMLPSFYGLPRLPFTFTINGITYSSVNYSFSIDPFGPKQEQVDLEHPVGSIVDVYYNPEDPRQSVVKPGANPHFYAVIGAGIVLFLLGFYIITRPRELI